SLVLSVANPRALSRLAPALAVGVALMFTEAGLLLWRAAHRSANDNLQERASSEPVTTRPFRLAPALVLAVVLTAVTVVARWAQVMAGAIGAIAAAAFAGFADAHAPSLAAATLAASNSLSMRTALLAIGSALATNTIAKIALAAAVGGWRFGLSFTAAIALPVVGTAGALIVALN
ncbi:MAG TPA: DUF4010 domain-containing protein, partial [Marmoricola sp.]|nr:DUF4010 domain-containing protein [Marmoricola sp.]